MHLQLQEEQEARTKNKEDEEEVGNQPEGKEVKSLNQEVEDEVAMAKRQIQIKIQEEEVMRSGVFPPSHGLVLFHLPPTLGEAGLVQMFQQFGTLVGVTVLQGSSGQPFAFVFLSTAEEAEAARREVARSPPWAPFHCER